MFWLLLLLKNSSVQNKTNRTRTQPSYSVHSSAGQEFWKDLTEQFSLGVLMWAESDAKWSRVRLRARPGCAGHPRWLTRMAGICRPL